MYDSLRGSRFTSIFSDTFRYLIFLAKKSQVQLHYLEYFIIITIIYILKHILSLINRFAIGDFISLYLSLLNLQLS